jgi:hypothetical protein
MNRGKLRHLSGRLVKLFVTMLTIACTGCAAQCLLDEQSHVFVRVFDRSGRFSTSAIVTASGSPCELDRFVPNENRYRCDPRPGDIEIEASLDGHTASTKVEATLEGCAGKLAPVMTIDLTP